MNDEFKYSENGNSAPKSLLVDFTDEGFSDHFMDSVFV